MRQPSPHDTIVAVATATGPAVLGALRISGPEAFALVRGLGPELEPPARFPRAGRVRFEAGHGVTLPAQALWFAAPRSYTGQDLVELHLVGAPPLLDLLVARLIDAGGRQAGPGEFTARAFLAGKLDAEQVEGVLGLIHASDAAAARAAARAVRGETSAAQGRLGERVLDLVAAVEAGIDFADEEGVAFIEPARLRRELAELIEEVDRFVARAQRAGPARRPRVVLAGRPNAGKSTLFNALLGRERAIVSPRAGTTRDVLEAEWVLEGQHCLLQDAAGLGWGQSELDSAADRRSREALAAADLLIWVHAADSAWTDADRRMLSEAAAGRPPVLVRSKADLGGEGWRAGAGSPAPDVSVSVVAAPGISGLRALLAERLGGLAVELAGLQEGDWLAARAALAGALAAATDSDGRLLTPELVAADLRDAAERVPRSGALALPDEVLGRIYGRFCIGK